MAIEDDDKPRKKITHEIGQDLSLLSVEELTERIALMNSEIERLQAGGHEKARVKGCGEQFFQVVNLDRSHHVVPANAGTHTPRLILWQAAGRLSAITTPWYGPAFAGTTWSQCKTRPMADMANNL